MEIEARITGAARRNRSHENRTRVLQGIIAGAKNRRLRGRRPPVEAVVTSSRAEPAPQGGDIGMSESLPSLALFDQVLEAARAGLEGHESRIV